MSNSRRFLLGAGLTIPLAPLLPAARAEEADPRMAERSIGDAGAPVTVTEWYSLTCPHCAAFHRDALPRIRAEIIALGKARLVYSDFPLDQLALTASMVARALPGERYEAFIGALLATQDRWAFSRSANPTDELAKMAALAGMGRETFNATIGDKGLRTAILKAQETAEKTYHVDSTPTFIFNGPGAKDRRESGGRSPDEFAKLVEAASG